MGGVLYTIVILLVVLGILVFIHELGHYWAAKAFGVWVHRFAVGIGPPVKRLSFRRGETEWAIAWLPIGGYVKMASREEDPSSGVLEGGAENAVVPPDRMFEAKPVWQRMIIILAGVTLNMLFAWAVYTGLALTNGNQYDPTTTIDSVAAEALPAEAAALASLESGARIVAIDGRPVESWRDILQGITGGDADPIVFEFAGRPSIAVPLHGDQLVQRAQLANALVPRQPPVLRTIYPGSPAERAGLEAGDSVVALDGTDIGTWTEAVAAIRAAPGRSLEVAVVRDGRRVTVTVTPDSVEGMRADSTVGPVGQIGAGILLTEPYSIGGAIGAGARATWVAAGTIIRTVRGLLTRRIDSSEVGGPILIGQLAAQSAQAGLEVLLAFMALISVNLAVVNLLPIPVLDGGAFLILAVEGVIRRPLPVRLREAVQMVGLILIIGLMVLAFSNDIRRLLGV